MGQLTKEKAMKKKVMTDVEFVTLAVNTALAGKGYATLAEATGMQVGSVAAKIHKLREKGVDIPRFKRQYAQTDVDALNAISKKLQADAKKKRR
jgi:biotin operon repressor